MGLVAWAVCAGGSRSELDLAIVVLRSTCAFAVQRYVRRPRRSDASLPRRRPGRLDVGCPRGAHAGHTEADDVGERRRDERRAARRPGPARHT
eukprot:3890553-Prymnesium_polylepis.1